MKKFKVVMDFAGWLELEIEANKEEDVIEKAYEKYSLLDIVELEILSVEVEELKSNPLEQKGE